MLCVCQKLAELSLTHFSAIPGKGILQNTLSYLKVYCMVYFFIQFDVMINLYIMRNLQESRVAIYLLHFPILHFK